MWSTAKSLGIINWCLTYISILTFLSIFLIVYKNRRELRDISFLLTCNTCFAALLTCLTMCIMTSSNLFGGFLIYNLKFCYIWGLFYDIFECSIYHSYCLQAFYRLCRVVFYKKKSLLAHSLYIILIVGQWLLVFVFLIPPIFVNWYSRLPTEQYCLIPYTYDIAETYHILILYLIPLISIGTIYIWIATFMRRTVRTSTIIIAAMQRQRNQRDLTVIKRIVILISILIILRFPTIIFMIHGAIVGNLYPLTYGIVGFITSVCLIFIGVSTIYTTTQLQKPILDLFVHQNNRIQNEPRPMNQIAVPMPKIDNGMTTQKSTPKHVLAANNTV